MNQENPKIFWRDHATGKLPKERDSKRFFARLRPHNRDCILILFYCPTEILPDSDQSSQGTDEEMDFEIAAPSKCECAIATQVN